MKKSLGEVLKEGGDYEHVGFLVGPFGDAWIVRAFSPEGKVYYYYAWVGGDGKDIFLDVLDKKKKRKGGYPTPSNAEGFILRMLKKGYRFDLGLLNTGRYELDETISWRTLKDWYEDFLKFFEAVQGRSIVWQTYDEVHQALGFINIPRDEWPDYWALLIWEREELIRRFKYFVSQIWFLTQGVIYKSAKRMEKHKGSIAREKPLQVAVEYMEKKNPIKTIQHTLATELNRYDKKQKDWLSSIIWQKLLSASKENRSITLDEIRRNLGYEDEEEE
jgi:hypothetical protein